MFVPVNCLHLQISVVLIVSVRVNSIFEDKLHLGGLVIDFLI